jgi:hypothetical protein
MENEPTPEIQTASEAADELIKQANELPVENQRNLLKKWEVRAALHLHDADGMAKQAKFTQRDRTQDIARVYKLAAGRLRKIIETSEE